MKWSGLPIVIFGDSGTSKDALHLIEEINNLNRIKVFDVVGFVSNTKDSVGMPLTKGYKVVTYDKGFKEFAEGYRILGVVIPMGIPQIKEKIYLKIKSAQNVVFPNIIHPNVIFDKDTVLFGFGNIIASGASLTHDISIGNFNLINNNATIGHDSDIGNYNVVNPGATISGNVSIGNNCLIGTGANVLQQLLLGNKTTVGAGAVVTKDVKNNETVIGIPAKKLKSNNEVLL